ncbi:MAG TPA: DUF4922 domain-containing protein [Bacteroidales bacterium]|nr:DUF4922 domain-containing protein [Bacteroidales bacterium]
MSEHQRLFDEQIRDWAMVAENYRALNQVLTKDFVLDGQRFRLQCNPKRLASTAANISAAVIQERPCFLCEKNRPAEQKGVEFEDFTLLVNPFPVFPKHFTIANGHSPQSIQGNFGTFLRLSKEMDDSVVFYNGPKCGASAPDHLHFQAGNKGSMPLEMDFPNWKRDAKSILAKAGVEIFEIKGLLRGGWLLEGTDEKSLTTVFDRLYNVMKTGVEEPMLNVLCWYTNEEWHCVVFPRKAHRPSCYFLEGAYKMLISPASVEMGGLIVAARLEDFERMAEDNLRTIFAEVSLSETSVSEISKLLLEDWSEPILEVGIVSATKIPFTFKEPFRMIPTGKVFQGAFSVQYEKGRVLFEDEEYDQVEFEPLTFEGASFELPEVIIGIGFHWERTECQAFEGNLKFIIEGDGLTAVNRVPLESYLSSVISSEMSAKASAELLKAHAVISRSWLMSQIRQKGKNKVQVSGMVDTETERIKWYDREDHTLYDVCADDHCQRYQGITKASTDIVRQAIRETRGLTLISEGEICDARFSKCCGGVMETFENCWENEPKSYLQGLADCDANQKRSIPDLTVESNASAWILGTPPAFCNTIDKRILEQVLNNYDQETTDFYRWKMSYSTSEISRLARERSGIDFGEILDLEPVERGVSGRLIKLRVVGSKRTLVLGKELEIRRTFSTSHLYSSAFVVKKTVDGFELIGAGWGHGVGLCQIGAAVMGEQGYEYQAILKHYYPNTELISQYL